MVNPGLETKVCAACGREFAWRRKWAKCWSEVRYCSKRCRGNRVRRIDLELEGAIHGSASHHAG